MGRQLIAAFLVLFAGQVLAEEAERPCWNRRSVMFLDAPTFAFETMSNGTYVIDYHSDVLASDGKLYRLKTRSSRVSLTNLWEKLPTGFVSVICRAQRPGGWIRTHWAWDETPDKIWMNCHVASALALQELAEFDKEEK